jgi:CBS domain containing-hemolysin-like protein
MHGAYDMTPSCHATTGRRSSPGAFAAGAILLPVAWVFWLGAIALLVVFGSVLAMAEAATTRMTKVRLVALREEGRRNVELLEEIENDVPRYLNAVYLSVMCVQNGSAILVAIYAERQWGQLGVTVASVLFTIGYFVAVEAMSKTFAVLHSDRVALMLAPVVWLLGRLLHWPTRALIGLANVLLPGRGLEQGPFVSEEAIRWMAQVGHEEGSIAEQEKELIHSVFHFAETVVREVMKPRPDIIAIEIGQPLRAAQELMIRYGYSRIPVYRGDLDHVEGVLFAKDVLHALHEGRADKSVASLARPPVFVPESKRVGELLTEMQIKKFHIALVTDEYGSVSGLVTMEDLLEELVGDISDEYDREEPRIELVDESTFRVNGRVSIDDVNEALDVKLPQYEWDTVAGLMLGLLGHIPTEGQEVRFDHLLLKAEKVVGRRIKSVLITREPADEPSAADEHADEPVDKLDKA